MKGSVFQLYSIVSVTAFRSAIVRSIGELSQFEVRLRPVEIMIISVICQMIAQQVQLTIQYFNFSLSIILKINTYYSYIYLSQYLNLL